MASQKCRKVIRRNGKIYVNWSRNLQEEFESMPQLREHYVDTLDDGAIQSTLRAMLVASVLRSGKSISSAEGKTISIDLSVFPPKLEVT